MLLIKLLLIPLKLVLKLLLYTIGGIILGTIFLITVINGVCSGLLKFIGYLVLGVCVISVITMSIQTGFQLNIVLPMIVSTVSVILVMYAPDAIQFILNRISSFSFFLFDKASFSLI